MGKNSSKIVVFACVLLLIVVVLFYANSNRSNEDSSTASTSTTNQTQPIKSTTTNLQQIQPAIIGKPSEPQKRQLAATNTEDFKPETTTTTTTTIPASLDFLDKKPNASKTQRALDESDILKKYSRVSTELLSSISGDQWSLFSDLAVADESTNSHSVFSIGPLKLFEASRQASTPQNHSRLIYNENQKYFAVLTGRVVIKYADIESRHAISEEYNFQEDSANPDIKTVYYSYLGDRSYPELKKALEKEKRIVRYHFEVVNNQWAKN